MEIQNEEHEQTGRFYVEENKETVAEMDYRLPGDNVLLIVHTEVNEILAGKGIGKQMVVAAVDFARKNSFKIKATCPFAKKVLDRSPGLADVYNAEKI